jgi:tetratricopeptide (TPR) repeat protein
MSGSLIPFPGKGPALTSEEGRIGAESVLNVPLGRRIERSEDLHLEDPEQLLAISTILWRLGEAEPARAREEAEFFYKFLETPKRPIGIFDERDYYLGEFALIAGGTCRILSRRPEARSWFDLAEANFVLAHNSSAHIARLAYQRLALKLEEHELDSVVQLAPRWVECFLRLDLREDALKCRFLEAHALKESGRLEDAKAVFGQIRSESEFHGFSRLSAMASENLFQLHAFLGEVDEAVTEAQSAITVLRTLNNRVALAKLQGGVGYLHRSQRKTQEAVNAFRQAQMQYAELEMHADVAATHLVLADLLLDANQPAQAEWEVRAALPVIDELKLVPEGIAALSLLRDSVRRRQIDRQALRSLNGYFEELGS